MDEIQAEDVEKTLQFRLLLERRTKEIMEDRDRLKAELEVSRDPASHICPHVINKEIISLERDKWRSQCEKMAEALRKIKNLEGLGKADEDIPDDKEVAYQLGSTDTLMDTFRISSEALTSYEAMRKENRL